jgi:hypothetical protein
VSDATTLLICPIHRAPHLNESPLFHRVNGSTIAFHCGLRMILEDRLLFKT